MTDSMLIFLAISLSMYVINVSVRESSSILLRSLILTIRRVEKDRSIVAVETGRVSTNNYSADKWIY